MRSQASKASPKKGAVKTSLKTKPPAKKLISPKKKKLVSKSLVKEAKKPASKDDTGSSSESDTAKEMQKNSLENLKAGPLKPSSSNESSLKKLKKDIKEKKETIKKAPESNINKVVRKNPTSTVTKKIPTKRVVKKYGVRAKVSKTVVKITKPRFSNPKTVVKKVKASGSNQNKEDTKQLEPDAVDTKDKDVNDTNSNEDIKDCKKDEENKDPLTNSVTQQEKLNDTRNKTEISPVGSSTSSPASSNLSVDDTADKFLPIKKIETIKVETERPPKFFTSIRAPRMVDIDVKCLKNSKGNLSVSERFLSMKCETKSDDKRGKSFQNALVSQGPEIDVYTFTEKVDSPKSVLSDFRSSVSKNVGRVRPIARVKGTVVDKTTEAEKKKYSPHRPIEEVVQQLKANKYSEEIDSNLSSTDLSSRVNDTQESDDAPKAIVSKSYKMVARKSSVTGQPFSPLKFPEREPSPSDEDRYSPSTSSPKKLPTKPKKELNKGSSDDDFGTSKFSLKNQTFHYSSSDESVNDSNDESKESSGSDASKTKKIKNKRYRKVIDNSKKTPSKELKELSKDSLVDLNEEDMLLLGSEKPSKRRRKLLSLWNGPKKHRMASLNALAKVHCLYENESRTHMELGLMRTVDRAPIPSTSKQPTLYKKKEVKQKEVEKHETTSESEYDNKKEKKDDSSESSDESPPQRTLRGVPGIRSAGKYWDPKPCTSSSEESELESKKKPITEKKKIVKSQVPGAKSDSDKPPTKMKKTVGVPVKKKRNRNEVVMDLKDMVVQKRMASLNATAILAASYEKRSPKSSKDGTTSDSCSDESFSQKPKNLLGSGVKSETKIEEPKKEKDVEEPGVDEIKQKVEVIVNQDTDVTITGVYATHLHEGFCTVSGMQYRISSTSHTQTTATANCEKEGCPREDGARYTPLTALSSMQPPADHGHAHPHPVTELGGLSRRAGCSSAFSAPSPSAHHDPGYYQPAGPLIKEGSADERALARYHLPHHHAPHPPVLPQYGPYHPDFCYGRYYRPPGPYYMPSPQGEGPMGGLGSEPYPPPQYYGTPPPCYQHSPQRIPYVEYRGCPCPINACPKNVLIGPATGKAPTGGGPDVPSALAPPGGAFRPKVRACAGDAAADAHGSGKDPPLEPEPQAVADTPRPCPLPAIGGASPKREMFDGRDKLRIASDVRAGEAIGPPSPARGSDGACVPQPPAAPRRARLGKAMARRSLAGDDTALLLAATPPAPPLTHHSDADDDVLAISPPLSVPIDLSSSDERSTPLVDIKKENEGPTFASARKPEAQALREHNSTRAATDGTVLTNVGDDNKPAKRRYSRTKLEIDMKDTQLEEGCKANGIGEHVKLIKRRKVSGDQPDPPRVELVNKEPKKKTAQPRKTPKSPPVEKKSTKRKLESAAAGPRAKKILLDTPNDDISRVSDGVTIINGVQTSTEKDDNSAQKPKIKSALLLDNLIRKNSIDRPPEKEPNPAELFLSPIENIAQNCAKKMLNINNNIVENASTAISGVRPDTIAAVSQLIGKKLAYKNACKLEKVDSKVTNNVKSVLKTPTVKSDLKEERKTLEKCVDKEDAQVQPKIKKHSTLGKNVTETRKTAEKHEGVKAKAIVERRNSKLTSKNKPPAITKDGPATIESSNESQKVDPERTIALLEKGDSKTKRCKLPSEIKAKNVEKVIKLLVSKRPVIKTDEATLVVEEACASPLPFSGSRRSKRRGARRGRRPLALAAPPPVGPGAAPRWSNGWRWDGEHRLAKVYVNNDSRRDLVARCWARMVHEGGDAVVRGDCVLLRASTARAQPFVARVARLWENPGDGEMMVSLVWYYRPEHTHLGRLPEDSPDEVFASRHRDANSVACIEDKCYVLTFNEYCRYRKRVKAAEEGIKSTSTIVPPLLASEMDPSFVPNDLKLPPAVSPELVLFCRKVYDFRTKKIIVPNK